MLDKFDKNTNPFKVPENYFEELTDNIMNSLPKESTAAKRMPLWKKTIPWIGAAAVVAAVFFTIDMIKNAPVNPMAQKIEKTEGISEKNLVHNAEYNEEDYFLFLEEEATQTLYLDALMFDE